MFAWHSSSIQNNCVRNQAMSTPSLSCSTRIDLTQACCTPIMFAPQITQLVSAMTSHSLVYILLESLTQSLPEYSQSQSLSVQLPGGTGTDIEGSANMAAGTRRHPAARAPQVNVATEVIPTHQGPQTCWESLECKG
jgi:hypothetical protein